MQFLAKHANIGDQLVPRRGRDVAPAVIRQMHRPDRSSEVEYENGTKETVRWAVLRDNYTMVAHDPSDLEKSVTPEPEPEPKKAPKPKKAKAEKTAPKPREHGPAGLAAMVEAGRLDGSEKCHRGHVLSEDNVIVWASAPTARRCKACYALKRAEQAKRRKAKAKAAKKAAGVRPTGGTPKVAA